MYLTLGAALLLLLIAAALAWPWLDRLIRRRIEERLSHLLHGEARIAGWGLSGAEIYLTGLHLNANDGRQLQVNEMRLRGWLSYWLRGEVLQVIVSHWTLSALPLWRESMGRDRASSLALDLVMSFGAFDLGSARADWFLVDSARIRLDAGFSSLGPAVLRSPSGDRLSLSGDERFVLELNGISLRALMPGSSRAALLLAQNASSFTSLSGAFDLKDERVVLKDVYGQGLFAGLLFEAELKSREDFSLDLRWAPSAELQARLVSLLDLSPKQYEALGPLFERPLSLVASLAANAALRFSLEVEGLRAQFQGSRPDRLWPLVGVVEAEVQADLIQAIVERSGQEVLRLDPEASPLEVRVLLEPEALRLALRWPQLPFLWTTPDGRGGLAQAHYLLSEVELELIGRWGSSLLSLERGDARFFDGTVSLSELALDLAELSYLGRLNYENLRLEAWPLGESERLGEYFGGRGSGFIEFSGRDFDPIGFRALGELHVKSPVFAFLDHIQGFLTSFGLPPLHRESPHDAHAKIVMADGGFTLREIQASLISVALRGHWGFDKDFQTDSHVRVTIQPTLFQRRALSGLFSALMREPLELEFTGTGPIEAPRFTPHYSGGVGEVLRRFFGA